MTDLFIVLFSKKPSLIFTFFSERVFLEVDKNDKDYFEMLATHPEKTVRDVCAKLLLFCINQLFYVDEGTAEEKYTIINTSLDKLLDLMPNEVTKHWMRLDTYLTFIRDLAKSHIKLLKLLIEKKILTRFMDLMGKYNPN